VQILQSHQKQGCVKSPNIIPCSPRRLQAKPLSTNPLTKTKLLTKPRSVSSSPRKILGEEARRKKTHKGAVSMGAIFSLSLTEGGLRGRLRPHRVKDRIFPVIKLHHKIWVYEILHFDWPRTCSGSRTSMKFQVQPYCLCSLEDYWRQITDRQTDGVLNFQERYLTTTPLGFDNITDT